MSTVSEAMSTRYVLPVRTEMWGSTPVRIASVTRYNSRNPEPPREKGPSPTGLHAGAVVVGSEMTSSLNHRVLEEGRPALLHLNYGLHPSDA